MNCLNRTRWLPLLAAPIAVVLCLGVRVISNDAANTPHAATNEASLSLDDSPLPEYIGGDECLFCHRFETAQRWQDNRHNRSIRGVDSSVVEALRRHESLAGVADDVQFIMGHTNRLRFLRKGRGYGRLELLSAEMVPTQSETPPQVLRADHPQWHAERFGAACAGCHTTQTDSRTQTFSAISLDCYVCHGNSTLEHTKDTTQMLFARSRKEPARVVVSICGQCHLRGGRSNRSGLPYPYNYIAGDDLFADFRVDLTAADDPRLNPGDRHIYHNARAVMERSMSDVTCSSCHNLHAQSTVKHRRLVASDVCFVCHERGAARWARPSYEVHSPVCGY
jgi:hypothetical protein